MIENRTIAAIKIAQKQLGLDDDTYRAILQRVAGVGSARDLDEAGARKVMAEFERLGFVNEGRRKRAGNDSRPLARKAVAMWMALHNLDEVERGTDKAFGAFVSRVTRKQLLRFCDTKELNQVVEALKAWGSRVGWSDHTALGLVLAQLQRLRAADPAAAADVDLMSTPNLPRLANRLGERLRELKLGQRHKSQKEGA